VIKLKGKISLLS